MNYAKEILTVLHNDIVIGYMARRQVLYAWGDIVPNQEWCIAKSIIEPSWHGSFKTRKEARLALMGMVL